MTLLGYMYLQRADTSSTAGNLYETMNILRYIG
jgi:hypothetical protein